MPGFNSAGNGDLTSELFLTETDILDDLVGDSLFLWGKNGNGQLGDGILTGATVSPVQTSSGGTIWRTVSCGRLHTAAIKTDGTLWAWGTNYDGRLGDGTSTDQSSPVQTVSGGNNWKQVCARDSNTAAVKTDGTLWLWGTGARGELGNNATTDRSSPVQTVAGGTNWKQVAIDSTGSVAVKTDGTLWVWGNPNIVTDATYKSSPVQTIAGGTNWKVADTFNDMVAAIKTDGTLWTWGQNAYGQLGDNTVTARSSPVQTVTGGTTWKTVSIGGVSAGLQNMVAAIKTDGTLWTWGRNNYGQLGDNSTVDKSSPVQTVAGGTNWKHVNVGEVHMCAIKLDGTLWVWGRNHWGQLGVNNGFSPTSSPVQTTAGGTNWKVCDAGGFHSAAITTGQVT